MRWISALAGGLLLWITLGRGVAWAGACSGTRFEVRVEVEGGRVVPSRRLLRVRYGLMVRKRGGWPSCRSVAQPVPVKAWLAYARSRRGPWKRIAFGMGRDTTWTPPSPGLWWLRVSATDPRKTTHVRLTGVLVGRGPLRVPAARPAYQTAQLWDNGKPTDVVARRAPGGRRSLTVPRHAGWWLLSGAGGSAWLRVGPRGALRVTPATATLRIQIDPVTRFGWQMWLEHPGMPRIPATCRRECVLTRLPVGAAMLRVRPVSGGAAVPVAKVPVKTGGAGTRTLSAMHVLARKAQPATLTGALGGLPPVRGLPGPRACRNARPFDAGALSLALGRALCFPAKRGTGWVAQVAPPSYLARGVATTAASHGRRVVWAESVVRPSNRDGRVLLFLASRKGVVVEQVPLAEPGRADSVAVRRDGAVVVVGRQGHGRSRQGFVAVRGRRGWVVHRRSGPVRAVRAYGRGVLAVESQGLTRCLGTCRRVAAAREPIASLVTTPGGLRVVARSGAIYALRGRRLRRVRAKPAFGMTLSRVVTSRAGVYGLFGPVIAGSEYHPYCVASVVASLTRSGWKVLHRVGGERGKRLDCQNDDRRPPVAVDLAVAGHRLFVRRRARRAGVLPGFIPLEGTVLP